MSQHCHWTWYTCWFGEGRKRNRPIEDFFSPAQCHFSKAIAYSILGNVLSIAPLDVATSIEMCTKSFTLLVEQRARLDWTTNDWRHRSLVICGSGQTGGWRLCCGNGLLLIVWWCTGSTVGMNMHFNVIHGMGGTRVGQWNFSMYPPHTLETTCPREIFIFMWSMLTQGICHVYIKQRMYMCIHPSKQSSKRHMYISNKPIRQTLGLLLLLLLLFFFWIDHVCSLTLTYLAPARV